MQGSIFYIKIIFFPTRRIKLEVFFYVVLPSIAHFMINIFPLRSLVLQIVQSMVPVPFIFPIF